jgi:uncharacterized protein
MRLYASKVTALASELCRTLLASGAIEAEKPREVELDIVATLQSYLATEKEVNDKTRELLERTGRGAEHFSRVRGQIAETKGIRVGEEALDYLLEQLVLGFGNSANVDEIFAEDVELKRQMRLCFRRYMSDDAGLDEDVRALLRHVQEGSPAWDVEYQKALALVKRKKGLS